MCVAWKVSLASRITIEEGESAVASRQPRGERKIIRVLIVNLLRKFASVYANVREDGNLSNNLSIVQRDISTSRTFFLPPKIPLRYLWIVLLNFFIVGMYFKFPFWLIF